MHLISCMASTSTSSRTSQSTTRPRGSGSSSRSRSRCACPSLISASAAGHRCRHGHRRNDGARDGDGRHWTGERWSPDAAGHGRAVLPRLLRRSGHGAGAGRNAGQRGPRAARHHRRLVTDFRPPDSSPAGTTTGARSGGSTSSPATRPTVSPRWSTVGPDIEVVPEPLVLQVPIIVETLTALGIPIVGKAGYEADDIIGTLATTAEGPVDVVTGDRDLFQVVDDTREVRVIYTARGMSNLEIVTDAGAPRQVRRDGRAVRRLRGHARRHLRRPARVAASARRPRASLLAQFGDLDGVIAAAGDPGSAAVGRNPGEDRGCRRLPHPGADGRRGRARSRPAGGRGEDRHLGCRSCATRRPPSSMGIGQLGVTSGRRARHGSFGERRASPQ